MNLLDYHVSYNQADLLQLDLSGVKKLNIWSQYSNTYEEDIGLLYIKINKNIKRLPLLCDVIDLHIVEAKIRKINYNKLDFLSIRDTRIKSIKMCVTLDCQRCKIKDYSYIGLGQRNKYLMLLKN